MTDAPHPTESAAAVTDTPEATPDGAPPAARRRWVPWVAGGAVVLVFIMLVVGTVVWALSRSPAGAIDSAKTRSAFDSAMHKAGTTASFPDAPVELTTLRASGGHPFSATFSDDELAALLNTYTHTATVAGSKISMRAVTLRLAGDGAARISATVDVDGSAYGGAVTGPIGFTNGLVTSPGATSASAEGFALNAGQRAQITGPLLGYFNAYLSAAPGLKVGTANVTPDGFAVTGIAPDRIEVP